ncbi:putative phosphoribomutase isoform X1 [Gossypium australe]|uniref:Putative phosphoribomutase isoform X1 n=1 Tax=Gossypium australe TaxID=47621 RepID=A0A5B6WJU6_9ROSI|nr:putative phosphoribomutase isoform X1 [Gossypium australe]
MAASFAMSWLASDSSNRDHEIGVTNYPIAEQGRQGPPLQKHEEASRPIMVGTVVQYKNEEGTESRCTECVICLEEFKDGVSCRVLTNCNHLYHQLCIDEWLVKNSHCPLCRGGKHHRCKRGYKNVIDEAIRLNSIGEEPHLAIETSGHGDLKENHWLDDGAYLMRGLFLHVLGWPIYINENIDLIYTSTCPSHTIPFDLLQSAARASGKGVGSKVLTDLIEGLEEPAIAVELRIKINQNHPDLKGRSFRKYGEAVLQHLGNSIASNPKLQKAPVNYEGVRVSGFGGWFLLRLSLHDPVLPLNIEAPSHEDAVKLGLEVAAAVKEFQALDTSALDKFILQTEIPKLGYPTIR